MSSTRESSAPPSGENFPLCGACFGVRARILVRTNVRQAFGRRLGDYWECRFRSSPMFSSNIEHPDDEDHEESSPSTSKVPLLIIRALTSPKKKFAPRIEDHDEHVFRKRRHTRDRPPEFVEMSTREVSSISSQETPAPSAQDEKKGPPSAQDVEKKDPPSGHAKERTCEGADGDVGGAQFFSLSLFSVSTSSWSKKKKIRIVWSTTGDSKELELREDPGDETNPFSGLLPLWWRHYYRNSQFELSRADEVLVGNMNDHDSLLLFECGWDVHVVQVFHPGVPPGEASGACRRVCGCLQGTSTRVRSSRILAWGSAWGSAILALALLVLLVRRLGKRYW